MLVIFVASSLGLTNLAWALSGSAVVLVFFLNSSAGPLIGNMVSGLFLIGDPDFTVGMRVITNDGKTEGIIKGIDMRKVRIQDAKGKLHVVPNSLVENTEWVILERKAK
jgi:small-conductance mechanosensitive channel